jgi:hypothetical protein
MKSHFEKQGRDIEIFVFARDTLSMTASLMQKLVKWRKFQQNKSTDADTINYLVSTRVGNLLQVCGKERTHIFHYEDALSSRYPRGVIDYFAELLGIPSESLPTQFTRPISLLAKQPTNCSTNFSKRTLFTTKAQCFTLLAGISSGCSMKQQIMERGKRSALMLFDRM